MSSTLTVMQALVHMVLLMYISVGSACLQKSSRFPRENNFHDGHKLVSEKGEFDTLNLRMEGAVTWHVNKKKWQAYA
jgi:hypothetical protein